MTARYFPEVFDVGDMKSAREIILTNEGPGADTDRRWELETPYVVELIRSVITLRPEMLILDYGCGIGRLAKAIIDEFGCSVLGVDISTSMRAMANEYVGSEKFTAVSPRQFDVMVDTGLRADAALAVWVLQHCLQPADDIARINRGLARGGKCFVLNMPKRAIPAQRNEAEHNGQFVWAADGIDIAALLRSTLHQEVEGTPNKPGIPLMAAAGAYWMALRQK